MTRAIELLDDLLPIFNIDDAEYKIFIGDNGRVQLSSSPVLGSLVEYEAADLPDITDEEDTDLNMLPMQSDGPETVIKAGDFEWRTDEPPGDDRFLTGQAVGATAGTVTLQPAAGQVWEEFATISKNGLQNIVFPPLGIGEMSVGPGGSFIVR